MVLQGWINNSLGSYRFAFGFKKIGKQNSFILIKEAKYFMTGQTH